MLKSSIRYLGRRTSLHSTSSQLSSIPQVHASSSPKERATLDKKLAIQLASVAFDSYAGVDEGSFQFTTSINNTVSLTSQSFLDTKLPRLSKTLPTSANNNDPSSLHKIATPLPRTETPLWDEPLQLAGIDKQDLQPILYLENHDTHTQLWAYWNYDKKVLCISFRGTEQDQWQDLLTDITLTPIGLDVRKITDGSSSDSLIQAEDQDDDDDSWFSVNKLVEATKAQILSASQDQTTSSDNDDKDDDRKKSANNDSSTIIIEDTVEGQVASAVSTVHSTAKDLQRALERVKMGFDQYNILTGIVGGTEDGKSTSCCGTDETSSTPETDHSNDASFSLPSSSSSSDDKKKSATWVHSGFLHAYDSVRPDIYKIIDTVLKKEPKGEWTVITTGHSLGGALATLCAFDIALRKRWTGNNNNNNNDDDDDDSSSDDKPALKMYNYGSPRVGNKEFAEQFDAAVPDAWRIVNGNDVVCSVPRLLGYCHVGHEVQLGTAVASNDDDDDTKNEEKQKQEEEKNAEVKIQHSSEKREAASVSDFLPSVAATIPAMAGSILGQVLKSGDSAGDGSSREMEEKKKAEEAQLLWEAEKEAWAALFDAEALNCHMEALYLESLKTLI
jgi:hypothetical protein